MSSKINRFWAVVMQKDGYSPQLAGFWENNCSKSRFGSKDEAEFCAEMHIEMKFSNSEGLLEDKDKAREAIRVLKETGCFHGHGFKISVCPFASRPGRRAAV